MNRLEVRVRAKTLETPDICILELVNSAGKTLPVFEAGAHIDVHLPNGLVRQYSLCNDPSVPNQYAIAVLKDSASRGGSEAVHSIVNEGDVLQISEPKNLFSLIPSAKKSLLLAGGIGVTPILAMAYTLTAQGADFDMHYCTRSHQATAFKDAIAKSSFASRVQFHYSNQRRLDIESLLAQPQDGVHLYACGPKRFMDAVISLAEQAGWAKEYIHYEYFAAPEEVSDGIEFDVTIKSSGKVIRIPASSTVTQVLAEHGIVIPISCEQGVCGTCLTNVFEGTPDHRDMYLSPQEQDKNNCFLPCCSRSLSPMLVLDL